MKKYLVALRCGGETGSPKTYYENHEIVQAPDPMTAMIIYNEKHKCNYYYAFCRGEVTNGFVLLPVKDFIEGRKE